MQPNSGRHHPGPIFATMDVRRTKPTFVTPGSPAEKSIERLRYALSRLHTAPQHTAVLDCLFNLCPRRTDPVFEDLVVVDDRLVFARSAGESTFRHFVGRREALVLNVLGFVQHLGLGEREREYALSRIDGIPRRRSR